MEYLEGVTLKHRPRNMNPEKEQWLSPELQAALEPLLATIESLSQRIGEYSQQIGKFARPRRTIIQ